MKKDTADLPPHVVADMQRLAELPDDEIDTSDIPEVLDWSGARRGVFYRPTQREGEADEAR